MSILPVMWSEPGKVFLFIDLRLDSSSENDIGRHSDDSSNRANERGLN